MLTVNAAIREKKGKGASRRLRLENKVPAIIYGDTGDPIVIALNHDIILNSLDKGGFNNQVLMLSIDHITIKVKVQSTQYHPFKPKLIHIDFIFVV